MFTSQPRNVSEMLLQIFRERQEVSVNEMLALLSSRGLKCSQRAAYKELKDLIERGIVVRTGKHYSLSLTWVLALLQTAEDFYATLVDEKIKRSYLPAIGEKKSWRFYDLQHLDRLWLQMIFLLFEESRSRQMFIWVPYFWFDLVHYQKDLEAQDAMRVAGNKMFMILGHDCFLSRLPVRYWNKEVYEWSYAQGPFHNLNSTYYDVIDDLILTVELTPKTTREIKELFDSVRGAEDLGLIRKFESIKSSAPCKLSIERNPQKAEKLLKKFRGFFAGT